MRSLRTTARGLVLAALPVAVGGLIVGCGGSSSPSGASSSPSSQAGASSGGAAGTMVTATETEYKIKLSQSSFKPGTYTFVVVDRGQVGHSLKIEGPGVSDKTLPQTLQPGQSARLTVTLQAGTYELSCPVDGHKGLGMDLKIQVAG